MHDETTWNALILAHAPPSGAFLSSWQWGACQEAYGAKVIRLAQDGESEALAQIVFSPLPFGKSRATISRGPLLENPSRAHATSFWKDVVDLAKKEGALSLLVEPASTVPPPHGAREVHERQPRTTQLLDLTKPTDVLLNEMHEKTRYNIRLAAKKGVTVREGGKELFEELWPLLAAAAERDRFRTHPKSYYATILGTLGNNIHDKSKPSARVLLAEKDGALLAGMLLITFGSVATYLHGGSSNEQRNLMAPYLLQWEAMQRTKAAGYSTYDFWGIAPPGDEAHPLAGVTRFKKGFGGSIWTAPASQELPISPFWFTVYTLVQKLRGRG